MEQMIDITLMLLVFGIVIIGASIIVTDWVKKSRMRKTFNNLKVDDIYESQDTVDCPYDEYKKFVRIVDKKVSENGKKKYVRYEYLKSPLTDNVLEWEIFIRLYTLHEKKRLNNGTGRNHNRNI